MLLGTNLNPSCLYLALTCLIFWLWRTASYYFSTHCSPRYFSKKYQFMYTIWQMSNLLEKTKEWTVQGCISGRFSSRNVARFHLAFIISLSWKEKILDVQTGNGLDSPVPNLHSCSKGQRKIGRLSVQPSPFPCLNVWAFWIYAQSFSTPKASVCYFNFKGWWL